MGKNQKNSNSDNGYYTGCYIGCLISAAIIIGLFYGCYMLIKPTDYIGEIESAIENHQFSRAHALLRGMKEDARYKDVWLNSEGHQQYLSTYNKVIQAEISFLVNERDQQSSDRLIEVISEYPVNHQPAIGVTHSSDIIEANEQYNAEVGKYNGLCNTVLSRAISTGNLYLAEGIVKIFKPTLSRKKVDTHLIGEDEYDFQYVENDKEKALEQLNAVIKDGKFRDNN